MKQMEQLFKFQNATQIEIFDESNDFLTTAFILTIDYLFILLLRI